MVLLKTFDLEWDKNCLKLKNRNIFIFLLNNALNQEKKIFWTFISFIYLRK